MISFTDVCVRSLGRAGDSYRGEATEQQNRGRKIEFDNGNCFMSVYKLPRIDDFDLVCFAGDANNISRESPGQGPQTRELQADNPPRALFAVALDEIY